MFGLFPHNLCAYGNEAVAVPHPPLRGTFPPGEGISQTLRLSNTNLSFLRRYCPGTQIGSPIRGSRRFCSAAAAVIVFAAAPVVVAAVAEKEDQDEDPPPVVAAEAIAQIIVAAHKITSEMD